LRLFWGAVDLTHESFPAFVSAHRYAIIHSALLDVAATAAPAARDFPNSLRLIMEVLLCNRAQVKTPAWRPTESPASEAEVVTP
jgi:hypothetical protein